MGTDFLSVLVFLFPLCILASNNTLNLNAAINDTGTSTTFFHNVTQPLKNSTRRPIDDIGSPIGPTESAIILAAAFIIFACVGYAAMIIWRRHLQHRYGTSDVLITSDVYDITDLRNFEI